MRQFSIFKLSLTILSVLFLHACQPDEPINSTKISKGVFVANQGPFSNGTGTITYRSSEDQTIIQDVFGQMNNGAVLGNIVQSLIKFDNKFYIAVNNANKVIVTDDQFNLISTIDNVALPRYFATDGSKLYLSTWGADFRSGKILEINTFTNGINKSIAVGNAPEQMLIKDSKLYVTLSSPYGEDSDSIAVIDIPSNNVVEKIFVGDSPTSIVKDANNDIWVLCTGNFAVNPANNTTGSLVNINKSSSLNFPLSNGVSNLVINKAKDKLYFIQGDKVFSHPINAGSMGFESVFTGNAYALGINNDDILHLADPKDYSSQGVINTINLSSNVKSSFPCGIAPGFFYFVE